MSIPSFGFHRPGNGGDLSADCVDTADREAVIQDPSLRLCFTEEEANPLGSCLSSPAESTKPMDLSNRPLRFWDPAIVPLQNNPPGWPARILPINHTPPRRKAVSAPASRCWIQSIAPRCRSS